MNPLSSARIMINRIFGTKEPKESWTTRKYKKGSDKPAHKHNTLMWILVFTGLFLSSWVLIALSFYSYILS